MKRFLALTALSISFLIASANAQQMVEVVHLKDGGLIRGTIIEQVPNESLKIKTKDGNVFVYEMNEVEKITKEEADPSHMMHRGSPPHPMMFNKPYEPALSFVLSFLIPGVGQMYNGDVGLGIAHFLGFTVSAIVMYGSEDAGAIGAIGVLGIWLWSIIDAPISAAAKNREAYERWQYYGHMFEYHGSGYALGFDIGAVPGGPAAQFALHF